MSTRKSITFGVVSCEYKPRESQICTCTSFHRCRRARVARARLVLIGSSYVAGWLASLLTCFAYTPVSPSLPSSLRLSFPSSLLPCCSSLARVRTYLSKLHTWTSTSKHIRTHFHMTCSHYICKKQTEARTHLHNCTRAPVYTGTRLLTLPPGMCDRRFSAG